MPATISKGVFLDLETVDNGDLDRSLLSSSLSSWDWHAFSETKQIAGRIHSLNHYIFAPIKNGWYEPRTVRTSQTYGLLLIDGPPGHIGRLGMLKHLDLFDLSVPIVVDDVHRSAERLLLVKLAEAAGRDYEVVTEADKTKQFGIIV